MQTWQHRIISLLAFTILAPYAFTQGSRWCRVARQLGGSGRSQNSNYVRIIDSNLPGQENRPPVWIMFEAISPGAMVRGSIPVLRTKASERRAHLRRILSSDASVTIADPYGEKATYVSLRFETIEHDWKVAKKIRLALNQMKIVSLATIKGSGVIQIDRFECEDFWTLKTDSGEFLEMKNLAPRFKKPGLRLSFHVEHGEGLKDQFCFFGSTARWTANVHVISLHETKVSDRKAPQIAREIRRWIETCQVHARSHTRSTRHKIAGSPQLSPDGFMNIGGPSKPVCRKTFQILQGKDLPKNRKGPSTVVTLFPSPQEGIYYYALGNKIFGPLSPHSTNDLKVP